MFDSFLNSLSEDSYRPRLRAFAGILEKEHEDIVGWVIHFPSENAQQKENVTLKVLKDYFSRIESSDLRKRIYFIEGEPDEEGRTNFYHLPFDRETMCPFAGLRDCDIQQID